MQAANNTRFNRSRPSEAFSRQVSTRHANTHFLLRSFVTTFPLLSNAHTGFTGQVGTVFVNNYTTSSSTAFLQIDVADPTSYDRIIATGAASVGTLLVSALYSPSVGDVWTSVVNGSPFTCTSTGYSITNTTLIFNNTATAMNVRVSVLTANFSCTPACVNGRCTARNFCTCFTGWSGTNCSTPSCQVHSIPGCQHGGTCLGGSSLCSCPTYVNAAPPVHHC